MKTKRRVGGKHHVTDFELAYFLNERRPNRPREVDGALTAHLTDNIFIWNEFKNRRDFMGVDTKEKRTPQHYSEKDTAKRARELGLI